MINKSKIWTIISHEYLLKVKSKGFIIGTFLAPIAIVALIAFSVSMMVMFKDTTERKLAIIDQTAMVGILLAEMDTTKYYLSDQTATELKSKIVNEEIDGFVLIPKDVISKGEVEVFSEGGGGIGYVTSLENNLGKIIRRERMKLINASEEMIKLVESGVEIKTQKVTTQGVETDNAQGMAWIGYILGFVIYFLVFLYGGLVSRAVVEEKANRIIEVIASSAKPFEIMLGKVVGIGLVGLSQIAVWGILTTILSLALATIVGMFIDIDPATLADGISPQVAMQQAQQAKVEEIMSNLPNISFELIFGFIFFFLSGYFIYASLFAAVGSAVDNEQDAGQLQMPLTIPIMIPIFMIQPIMQNPDSTLATVLSLFPFFTPILMIVRIASTQVPLWELILAVLLQIITFIGALWVAGRIYRIGILMTGKKPKLTDLIKWVKM